MRTRTLTNVVLLLVAAVLAAVIAFAPRDGDEPTREPLTRADPRAVSRIVLETGSGERVELRRTDGEWDLVTPLAMAANEFRVSALLGVLAAPVHLRIDAAKDTLARYGLASPRGRVMLGEHEILFGDTEPINGRRYLLHDDTVALVDDAFFSHLDASAASYVHPAPLGRDPSPRDIRLPGARVYRDGGDWRVEPGDAALPAAELARLAEAWSQAQAIAVRPYDPGLEWRDEIVIEDRDGQLRFDVARTEYEVILGRRNAGIQYHLTGAAGARLVDLAPPG